MISCNKENYENDIIGSYWTRDYQSLNYQGRESIYRPETMTLHFDYKEVTYTDTESSYHTQKGTYTISGNHIEFSEGFLYISAELTGMSLVAYVSGSDVPRIYSRK